MKLRWTGFLLLFLFTTSALAMQPGPTRIIKCPESDRFVTKSSGYPPHERWSDGSSFPDSGNPKITRCDPDGKYFWVAGARVVGERYKGKCKSYLPGYTVECPKAWVAAKNMRSLSEHEYLEALAEGMARNRKEEVYLRTQAWWSANDAIRIPRRIVTNPFLPGTQARENLERLVELLDTGNPNARFTKAEALRQLGRFDEARHTLQATFQDEMEEMPNWFRDLVKKEDEETQQYYLVEHRKSTKEGADEMKERARWFLGLVEKRDVLVRGTDVRQLPSYNM